MLKVYRNTSIFMILVMIGVQWGFYKPYTSEFPNFKDTTLTIHIHGALLMSWLVLLIMQPLLIHTGRIKLHRTIGKVAYVLGPLIIISMFLVGKGSYWRTLERTTEQDAIVFMVLDIRGLLSFAIFWSLAMFYRKNPDAHMRYMIATGILAIGPGIARGLNNNFNIDFGMAPAITDIIDLLIIGFLLGFDIYRKKNYKPFLVVFLILLIGALLWQIRDGSAWESFARGYANMFY